MLFGGGGPTLVFLSLTESLFFCGCPRRERFAAGCPKTFSSRPPHDVFKSKHIISRISIPPAPQCPFVQPLLALISLSNSVGCCTFLPLWFSWQTSLLVAIFGLFQPYPTMADPVLAGCLFLCYPRTSARMRLVIPVGMAALVPALLLPTMRHLWLQAGTGNANFYYFQTVALNVLLAVFVLQFAAALVKRRKALTVAFKKRTRAKTGDRNGEDRTAAGTQEGS